MKKVPRYVSCITSLKPSSHFRACQDIHSKLRQVSNIPVFPALVPLRLGATPSTGDAVHWLPTRQAFMARYFAMWRRTAAIEEDWLQVRFL